MKKLLCRLLLGVALCLSMSSGVARAQALDFTGQKVLQFFTLIFEKDKWDRTGPAAAGQMTYKANAANARLVFFGPGGSLWFRAPRDEEVVVEMHAAHLSQPIDKIDQVNVNVGHMVIVSGYGLYEKDKWDRTILGQPFWAKYRANANNAEVEIQASVPDRRTVAFKFKAPSGTDVHWCNNVAHIPQDMTPPTGRRQRDNDVDYFDDSFLSHIDPWDDYVDAGVSLGATRDSSALLGL